jgi:hypothetical protein
MADLGLVDCVALARYGINPHYAAAWRLKAYEPMPVIGAYSSILAFACGATIAPRKACNARE